MVDFALLLQGMDSISGPELKSWGAKKKKINLLCVCVCVSLSVVADSVTPWTAAHQASLSMSFSRQGDWSGLPFLELPQITFSSKLGF